MYTFNVNVSIFKAYQGYIIITQICVSIFVLSIFDKMIIIDILNKFFSKLLKGGWSDKQ